MASGFTEPFLGANFHKVFAVFVRIAFELPEYFPSGFVDFFDRRMYVFLH
jgi:hypothetical protein